MARPGEVEKAGQVGIRRGFTNNPLSMRYITLLHIPHQVQGRPRLRD